MGGGGWKLYAHIVGGRPRVDKNVRYAPMYIVLISINFPFWGTETMLSM